MAAGNDMSRGNVDQIVWGVEAADRLVTAVREAGGACPKHFIRRECLKLCVSDLAHAVFRYGQAPKRPANIMAS